jgi:replicative DNA helicase
LNAPLTTNHLQDKEYEDAIIACLLVEPKDALDKLLGVAFEPDHFSSLQCRRIYRAILGMDINFVDELTVQREMEAAGTFNTAEGDGQYLQRCLWMLPNGRYADFYAKQVMDLAERRGMITEAQRLATDAINLKKPITPMKQPGAVFYYDKRS